MAVIEVLAPRISLGGSIEKVSGRQIDRGGAEVCSLSWGVRMVFAILLISQYPTDPTNGGQSLAMTMELSDEYATRSRPQGLPAAVIEILAPRNSLEGSIENISGRHNDRDGVEGLPLRSCRSRVWAISPTSSIPTD